VPPRKPQLAELYATSQREIQDVYLADERPWVIGFSGGKDSTTALQLVWYALRDLPAEKRTKPVYVVAGDTLVETPVIVDFLSDQLDAIDAAAQKEGLPISAHKVTPTIDESFWINLIGKGYPAPSKRFRWCTERMKINPANRFILDRVAEHGEVVLVLGVRRQESATRAQVMSLRAIRGTLLSRHTRLPNAFVYTPVRDYSVDDVWTYLLQLPSPWGGSNEDLVALYRASSSECPLVVDDTTPSCGSSRFGCWVCTVVTQDKAMEAMVDGGETWLEPLLEFRDFLADTQRPARKAKVRQHVRRDGTVRLKNHGTPEDPIIRGPYKLEFCQELLERLLAAQERARKLAPPGQTVELIAEDELLEIRKIWRFDRHDWSDSVPAIYLRATGRELPVPAEAVGMFDSDDEALLIELAAQHDLPLGLIKALLESATSLQGLKRRAGILDRVDRVLAREWREEDVVLGELEKGSAAA
jgi:DNA sulfur modification protein DndC